MNRAAHLVHEFGERSVRIAVKFYSLAACSKHVLPSIHCVGIVHRDANDRGDSLRLKSSSILGEAWNVSLLTYACKRSWNSKENDLSFKIASEYSPAFCF